MVAIVMKCPRFGPFLKCVMIHVGVMGLTEIIASHLESSGQIRYFAREGK
jgi:hypothetical protein